MTASRQVLRDIGHNRGPEKSLFALGYAAGGPASSRRDGSQQLFTTPEEQADLRR